MVSAIPITVSNIHIPEIEFIINADASESGLGATDGINLPEITWSEHYKTYHKNYLKLKVIRLVIKYVAIFGKDASIEE